MQLKLWLAAAVAVASTAGSAMLAAPEQIRPGELTQASVWIENRSRTEAIPVVLQETVAPIGVVVTGTPTVAMTPTTILQTRAARQTWEYRTITIAADKDAASALGSAGADGWEAAGVQFPSSSGTVLLLKRPR